MGIPLAARKRLASCSERQLLAIGRKLPHHQTFDEGFARFAIEMVRAIVADLRVGEDDDLAGIRGIRKDLLITRDRRIENNFSVPVCLRTKASALEDGSVLQGEDCFVQFLESSGSESNLFQHAGQG